MNIIFYSISDLHVKQMKLEKAWLSSFHSPHRKSYVSMRRNRVILAWVATPTPCRVAPTSGRVDPAYNQRGGASCYWATLSANQRARSLRSQKPF